MKKIVGITLVGLLCGASLAFAQEHRRPFEDADQNHDGKVSKAELQASMQKHFDEHFAKMDTNKDGVLDKDELANGFHGRGHHGHGRGGQCDHHKGSEGASGDHG